MEYSTAAIQDMTTGYPMKQIIHSIDANAQLLTMSHTTNPNMAANTHENKIMHLYFVDSPQFLLSIYVHIFFTSPSSLPANVSFYRLSIWLFVVFFGIRLKLFCKGCNQRYVRIM